MPLHPAIIVFLALILSSSWAYAADTCPAPGAAPDTTIPIARIPYRSPKLAAQLDGIRRQLASGSYAAIGLGDSIMERWPQASLAKALGAPVLNAGIGGDKTQSVLWRLRNNDWSRQHPRVVLIMVGTNNTSDPGVCIHYWGVRAVVDAVHRMFPKAMVAVISILPRGKQMLERDDQIRAIDANLRDGAAAGQYVYVDAHDAFYCGKRTPCDLVHGESNVHPSPAGYDLLVRLVRERLAAAGYRPTIP